MATGDRVFSDIVGESVMAAERIYAEIAGKR